MLGFASKQHAQMRVDIYVYTNELNPISKNKYIYINTDMFIFPRMDYLLVAHAQAHAMSTSL